MWWLFGSCGSVASAPGLWPWLVSVALVSYNLCLGILVPKPRSGSVRGNSANRQPPPATADPAAAGQVQGSVVPLPYDNTASALIFGWPYPSQDTRPRFRSIHTSAPTHLARPETPRTIWIFALDWGFTFPNNTITLTPASEKVGNNNTCC